MIHLVTLSQFQSCQFRHIRCFKNISSSMLLLGYIIVPTTFYPSMTFRQPAITILVFFLHCCKVQTSSLK